MLPTNTTDASAGISSLPRANEPDSMKSLSMLTTVESDIWRPATSSNATTSHVPSSPTRPVDMLTNSWATVTLPPEIRIALGFDSR